MEGESTSSKPPRRLSQIFDPISRLNELTRESRSTPSSPRLLPRRAARETNSSSVLPPPLTGFDVLDPGAGPCDGNAVNWQERCLELQLELHRSRAQATRTRDMLRDKFINSFEFLKYNLADYGILQIEILTLPPT
ncbi:hypothetical protein FQR65_LT02844 [Abscondita terminalis]|nr:hypothetical protein FQR65_LT02844 [Abscondita terminalis]